MGEKWRFTIAYVLGVLPGGQVALRYTLLHRDEGWCEELVETLDQAQAREERGHTICTEVIKQAMERRSQEYEAILRLEQEGVGPQAYTTEWLITRIAKIAPIAKRGVSEGPLLFGLRHRVLRIDDPQYQS
jgi:hypothetical protein